MTVTITGRRQAGKSEMLVALAAWLIRHGQRVLYVGPDMTTVQDKARRLEDNADGDDAYWFCRRNGRQRITHKSGGEILFTSLLSKGGRGFNCDTLILDEVPFYPHANPDTKFVYYAPIAAEYANDPRM